MGPPGSEKQNHALKVAEKYQLIYVQVNQLLKDAIRREGNTPFAKDLAYRLQNSEMCKSISTNADLVCVVPDDIIVDLVRERLEKPDCRINGWILDGCPMNLYQIKQLKELLIQP